MRHIRWQLTDVDLMCPFSLHDAVNCQTVNKSLLELNLAWMNIYDKSKTVLFKSHFFAF